jgi:hypothetical protein
MIDEKDWFSITTKTTCVKAGTTAAALTGSAVPSWIAGRDEVPAIRSEATSPAANRAVPRLARRSVLTVAFVLVGDAGIEDEMVNFSLDGGIHPEYR